jgi:hypothetical protein
MRKSLTVLKGLRSKSKTSDFSKCSTRTPPTGDSISTDDVVIVTALSAGATRLSLSE